MYFIALWIKSVICGFVKNSHLGLRSWATSVSSVELLFFPLLNWEEVNGFVLEYLPLLHFPKVWAKNLECIVSCHWETVVVVWCGRWVLLVAQRWHFRVDQLVLVCCRHASWVQRYPSGVGGLNHVRAELHWLLDSLRRNYSVVCAYLSNCVKVVIQVVRISSYSIYWSRVVSLVICPWARGLPVGSDYLLHWLVICINRSWLSPALFKSLCLILQSLSVLLICLNQLNFLLGTFISRCLICWLLVLKSYLFLSKTMGIWGLKRRWYCVHPKLHKVLLASLRSIGIFSGSWVLLLRWGHTIT